MASQKFKVYLLDISGLDIGDCSDIYQSFKQYRKDKITRLSSSKDKLLSFGAEYLIQKVCSDFSINYAKTEIIFAKQGKPHFGTKNVHFNNSHSGTKVLCVASNNNVGCDIEEIKKPNFALAKRFFTKQEKRMIGLNKSLFYKVWTRKEAILKCLGLGLTKSLDVIDVSQGDVINYEGKTYYLYSVEMDGYALSICMQDKEIPEINFELVTINN